MSSSSSSSSSSSPSSIGSKKNKSLGFVSHAIKRKDSFIQLIAMTGILLLAVRSLGQKYRLHDLREDNYHLEQEQKNLALRIARVKDSLVAEGANDPTGSFSSRLSTLFGDK